MIEQPYCGSTQCSSQYECYDIKSKALYCSIRRDDVGKYLSQ